MFKIKELIRPIYYSLRNQYNRFSGKPRVAGVILMLHRVDNWDDKKIYYNERLKVSPATLEKQILYANKFYDTIPIDQVPYRLKHPGKKPFVVYTMDDGYRDNLTKALPIFKKYNTPYTIFLTSNFPDGEAVLWWYEVEDLLIREDSVTLSNGITYPSVTRNEKNRSFLAIREEILKLDQNRIVEELNNLFANYKIDWTSKCRELSLTWDDVEFLKMEPLVTIGAHTKHHYNLRQLPTPDDIKVEIIAGYERVKEMTGIESTVFAYPFGSENEAWEREFQTLSSMNDMFSMSVRSVGGAVSSTHIGLYDLPRLMLAEGQNIISLKYFRDLYNAKG